MTVQEFKAWFSGFTEDLEGAPNDKQWARIKARVDEISTGADLGYRAPVPPYWPSGSLQEAMVERAHQLSAFGTAISNAAS